MRCRHLIWFRLTQVDLERGELKKSVVIVLRDLADRQRMTN